MQCSEIKNGKQGNLGTWERARTLSRINVSWAVFKASWESNSWGHMRIWAAWCSCCCRWCALHSTAQYKPDQILIALLVLQVSVLSFAASSWAYAWRTDSTTTRMPLLTPLMWSASLPCFVRSQLTPLMCIALSQASRRLRIPATRRLRHVVSQSPDRSASTLLAYFKRGLSQSCLKRHQGADAYISIPAIVV